LTNANQKPVCKRSADWIAEIVASGVKPQPRCMLARVLVVTMLADRVKAGR